MKKSYNYLVKVSLFFLFLSFSYSSNGQMANGQNKFVGNIMRSEIPDNYDDYWNQVTPENSGKWGVVEGVRDVMNWTDLDLAYNYAQQNNFPFKQHTLVWGAQAPSWIDTLSPTEQATEIEEWIQEYASRYPDTEMIDVVNEPINVTPSFKDAIGGDGITGWDWVIWSFEKARQYNPNAILLINEYSILGNRRNTTTYIEIINLLKDRGLIDGIGLQAHGLEYARNSAITKSLDDLAATGVPIYISELDLDFEDDTAQFNRMQELWPLLYEHPGVVGVTLWGYEKGKHWKPNAFLVGDGGTVGSWTASTVFEDYVTTGTGNLQVALTNDSTNNANDLEVDYVIIDGVTYQAEDMPINTGVYQNNSCGGSFSQIMNCDGYIQFPAAAQNITIRAKGVTGNEIMEAIVVEPDVERPALTWLREVYFGGTPSNNAPSVSITNPTNGSTFLENTNINITANANDSDGTIANVEFYVNGSFIGSDASSPYETNWSIGLGSFSLTAIATDNEGLSTTSSVINVVGQSDTGMSSTIHVQSISTGVVGVGKGNKKAQAIITVVDEFDSPIANVNVTGTFSGTFNETVSGVTQSNGTVELLSLSSAKGTIIVDICVDNLSHTLLTYDDTQNIITCTNAGSSAKSESSNKSNTIVSSKIAIGDTTLNVDILGDDDIRSVKIYDLVGKELYANNHVADNNNKIYDYNLNANTIYVVQISTSSKIIIKKIVKK